MRPLIGRFLQVETGATAIEYGLIAGLIALAIIGGVGSAGNSIAALWDSNNSRIQEVLKR